MRDAHEYPVLMDINHERSRQGLTPVVKLTVPVLKAHLRGKTVRGGKWTMGAKKREDLIEDYRHAAPPPLCLHPAPAGFVHCNKSHQDRASQKAGISLFSEWCPELCASNL